MAEYQSFPSASYRWGLGVMTSTQTLRVTRWFKTWTAASEAAKMAFFRNPVLCRWHADGERV